MVEAYVGQTKQIQYRSHSEKVTFALRHSSADFRLFGKSLAAGGKAEVRVNL